MSHPQRLKTILIDFEWSPRKSTLHRWSLLKSKQLLWRLIKNPRSKSLLLHSRITPLFLIRLTRAFTVTLKLHLHSSKINKCVLSLSSKKRNRVRAVASCSQGLKLKYSKGTCSFIAWLSQQITPWGLIRETTAWILKRTLKRVTKIHLMTAEFRTNRS